MILKSVLIITIVVVAMIGVMVPSVFAETVSNNIGSVTMDEKQYHIDRWGYCSIPIYGFIEIIEGVGSLTHYYPDGSTGHTRTFLAGTDGSFTVNNFLSCYSDERILVSYGDNEIGILNYSASDYRQYLEDQKKLKREEYKLQEQQNQFFTKVTEKPIDLKKLGIASFVDQSKNPRHYIDRYYNEPLYKEWFDQNYPQYISIYQAVGSTELEYRLAEIEDRAAEKKAAEKRALEQRKSEARAAEAAIRAAEAKAVQDTSNFLIIVGAAIAIISLLMILSKRKKKKSTSNTSQPSRTNTYSPPNPPSTNTESSTMFFYECPKCHSADIVNNPDGSVNCPDCGYRGQF